MAAQIDEILTSKKKKREASIRRLRSALSHHMQKGRKRLKLGTKLIAEAKEGVGAKTRCK